MLLAATQGRVVIPQLVALAMITATMMQTMHVTIIPSSKFRL
jgi:hypothetical protein